MFVLLLPFLLAATEPFEWGPVKGLKWTSLSVPGPGYQINVAAQSSHNPELYLAGGSFGGIWRSENGCKTWQPSETPIPLKVQVFLFHPENPDLVLAGTTNGLFSSSDSGITWTEQRKGFPGYIPDTFTAPVSTLTIIPGKKLWILAGFGADSSDAYTQNQGHLYKSSDWGESWNLFDFGYGDIRNITFSTQKPRQAVMASSIGVFLSLDRGTSWSRNIRGLPLTGAENVFAISKPFPALVVTMENKRRYISKDNGWNWHSCNNKKNNSISSVNFIPQNSKLLDRINQPHTGNGLSLQKSKSIAFSNLDPDIVTLVEQQGIWISTDKGKSFKKIKRNFQEDFFPETFAFSRCRKDHVFTWSINSTQNFPVFASLNKGENWTPLFNLMEKNMYDLLSSSSNPFEFLSLVPGKVLRTLNSGKSWQKVLFLPQNGKSGFFTPHPENVRHIFLTWGGLKGGLWKSHNQGQSWKRIFPALPNARGHVGVTSRGEILVCAGNAIHRWDRTEWTVLHKSEFSAIDLAITRERFIVTIFANPNEAPRTSAGEVWYSPDFGRKWFPLQTGISGPPPCSLISGYGPEELLILGTKGGGFYKLTWPEIKNTDQ